MTASPAIRIVRNASPRSGCKHPSAVKRSRPPAATEAVNNTTDPPSLTLGMAELARELKTSTRTIQRMNADGKLPSPVRIGSRSLRWIRQTLVEWLAAGCPHRDTFEAIKKGEQP